MTAIFGDLAQVYCLSNKVHSNGVAMRYGGREGGTEGRRDGGREGGRNEGRKEGGREEGREEGRREGGRGIKSLSKTIHITIILLLCRYSYDVNIGCCVFLCLVTDQLPEGFSQTFCEEERKSRPAFSPPPQEMAAVAPTLSRRDDRATAVCIQSSCVHSSSKELHDDFPCIRLM